MKMRYYFFMFLILGFLVTSASAQIQAPATCIENNIYTENGCIRKCIDGNKVDLKCCSPTERFAYDPNNTASIEGYYCYDPSYNPYINKAITDTSNTSNNYNNNIFSIIAGVIILGFIIRTIILNRRNKKSL